ncbi:protein FLOURY 1-like [Oryza brachyantha]|uniref:protein FLOURY 1-like n=1 Tax=Oryza brachyantha TaxID=4533 RepID=UPI001ADAB25B|nr:protein FLOURY 1-like [Oryza brachyantha]
MGGGNRVSGAGFLKPLAGVSFAFMPGAGALYFLVGSVLGFLVMVYSSESDEGGVDWASAERWVPLARSVGAPQMFVGIPLLLLATGVWRLGKRCNAVEGLVGNADATVQALRVGGVVCAVCGTKILALKKKGGLASVPSPSPSHSKGCSSDKPVARSLAAELEQEAHAEEDDCAAAGDGNGGTEEGSIERLKRRLAAERRRRDAALEELEKERRAAASAADEAMAKIACLRNEKALVEREARQFQEMAQQKQMYDRQLIESLQWVIQRFGMPCGEAEVSSERGVSETSEDDRDRK